GLGSLVVGLGSFLGLVPVVAKFAPAVAGLASAAVLTAVLVGLSLGFVTWWIAARDLSRMRAGAMDPAGGRRARPGPGWATAGIVMSVVVALIAGLNLLR